MADQFIYQMTDTWNNGATDFAGIQMDVTDSASLATSRLLDLKVGGASKFKIQKDGSVFLTSSSAGAAGPVITVYHNSASPLALDVPFKLLVQGEDSAGNTQDYGDIQVRIDDATSGSEDSSLLFSISVAGALTTLATLGGSALTLGTNVAVAFAGTGAATTRTNLGVLNSGYLNGLTVSVNVGDPTNDIDIAAGTAAEEGVANPDLMTLVAMTKRLDAAWAVGTNQGMRATGVAIADGTYHIFEIKRPDTQVVDIAADTSITGANIAANTNVAYTQKRRIFSITRVAGVIRPFDQNGDIVKYRSGVLAQSSIASSGAVLQTMPVPIGLSLGVLANIDLGVNGSSGADYGLGDAASGNVQTSVCSLNNLNAGALRVRHDIGTPYFSNTSGQIYRSLGIGFGTVGTADLYCLGYIDRRGQL